MFENRKDAGRQLAEELSEYAGREDVVVLGLPRGGVPVAFEVANALNAPLDVFVVRKLGLPGNPELAMGAMGSGGVRVMNADVVRSYGVSEEAIERVVQEEQEKLERREEVYRGARPGVELEGKTVLLVELPIFDEFGYPEQTRGVTAHPGLYFLGLHWLHTIKSGLFLGIAEDAAHVAGHIAEQA